MTESKFTTTQQIESIWKLGGLTRRELGKRVWNVMYNGNLTGNASELAYNFIFSIFPLLLFLLALFGLFASRGTQLQNSLMFYLATVLPPDAFRLLQQTVTEVTTNSSGGKLTFGIFLTLWAASGGMTSMISTLNSVYQVKESRPWWKVRLVSVCLTVSIATLVFSALALVLLGDFAAGWLGNSMHWGTIAIIAGKILVWAVALVFVVVSFSLVYYFAPDLKEQHWYWITPGSVVGVLLWLLASFAFRGYLHFFNSYSKTYGSLGAVIILLLWFYVAGLTFLLGGEINAEIEHAAAHRGHPEAKAEGEKKAA
jgi:membrane protein